jgi:hypothetical protein
MLLSWWLKQLFLVYDIFRNCLYGICCDWCINALILMAKTYYYWNTINFAVVYMVYVVIGA